MNLIMSRSELVLAFGPCPSLYWQVTHGHSDGIDTIVACLLTYVLAMDLWNWPETYKAKYVNYSILDPTLIIFQPTS